MNLIETLEKQLEGETTWVTYYRKQLAEKEKIINELIYTINKLRKMK